MMPRYIHGIGPAQCRIMIVGEFPSADDEIKGEPFTGTIGNELTKMLHEVGIIRADCYLTTVSRYRLNRFNLEVDFPTKKKNIKPEHVHYLGRAISPWVLEHIQHLYKEIEEHKPVLIIALGEFALWVLTGRKGIMSWRGSELVTAIPTYKCKVIPTLAPSLIIRQWSYRVLTVADLRRALRESATAEIATPPWRFTIRPDYEQVQACHLDLMQKLHLGKVKLSVDIETRHGHISCIGLAWSQNDAICIPLMVVSNDEGYWSLEQEIAVIQMLKELLTHPNVEVIGQNFSYDAQFIIRHWGFAPLLYHDTMVKQSVLFAGMTKALDFLSSMYCEHHVYWKDDGALWNSSIPEEQHWTYNCTDCIRTFEVNEVLTKSLEQSGLTLVYDFQIRLWYAVLAMMLRGVRIDQKNRGQFAFELFAAIQDRETRIQSILGHPLNVRSSKQMKELFYDDFHLPVQRNFKTGQPSLDDKSLDKLIQKEPLIKPLTNLIQDIRSLGVFLSTFVQASLDSDQRIRCNYNIAGTETFRFSSSKNSFGSGTNLQNIPKGNEENEKGQLALPNIRRLFIPDFNYVFFDIDLDRADLQVVVWEADDTELKQMLREGVDLHTENAKVLGCSRQMAKTFTHGTNYGGGARTMAMHTGVTVLAAERMQQRWFSAHPGIKEWHKRTETALFHTRQVSNAFGYRRFYFDRIEGLLPEALAWIPQSTVACVINRALLNIAVNLPTVQLLLQVHDSLNGQIPSSIFHHTLPELHRNCLITVPYPEPLIIPCGIKASKKSWGEAEDVDWPEVKTPQ